MPKAVHFHMATNFLYSRGTLWLPDLNTLSLRLGWGAVKIALLLCLRLNLCWRCKSGVEWKALSWHRMRAFL